MICRSNLEADEPFGGTHLHAMTEAILVHHGIVIARRRVTMLDRGVQRDVLLSSPPPLGGLGVRGEIRKQRDIREKAPAETLEQFT